MTKPKIVRTDAELDIIEQYMARVRERADVVTVASGDLNALAREAREAALILTCYDEIPGVVIEAAPKLKGIVKYGVGVNNIDLAAASRRGVFVANAPDYGSDTVADHAFALMLALMRFLPRIDAGMRREGWVWPSRDYLSTDPTGKTIGLIGIGRIGRAMARKTVGFDMTRLVCDPYVAPGEVADLDVEFVSLNALLERADIVSIHCVLTPETRGLLGAPELGRMKTGAFLINVSRAHIVDEAALIQTLREGRLGGAGCDVFWREPVALDHPMLAMDNVIVTPHLAWYTREAFERVERDTYESIVEILDGQIPARLRNPDILVKGVKGVGGT